MQNGRKPKLKDVSNSPRVCEWVIRGAFRYVCLNCTGQPHHDRSLCFKIPLYFWALPGDTDGSVNRPGLQQESSVEFVSRLWGSALHMWVIKPVRVKTVKLAAMVSTASTLLSSEIPSCLADVWPLQPCLPLQTTDGLELTTTWAPASPHSPPNSQLLKDTERLISLFSRVLTPEWVLGEYL